jgi:hypothetical protein
MLSTVAGCSAVGEFVGEALLEEVNIFNETDQQVSGTIEVIGPAGDTVLDEAFELVPGEAAAADDDEKNAATTYEDLWTEAGSYEVSIELANTDIAGTRRAKKTVTIADTQEDMLGITLGPGAGNRAFLLRAGDDPADISDPADVAENEND